MNNIIIQLIIVVASLILGMLAYPRLIKAYSRFITKLYESLGKYKYFTEEVQKEKVEKTTSRMENLPSIIGESKTKSGHSRTNTAKQIDNEKDMEKEDTFASSSPDNPQPMEGINVLLEQEEPMTPEEMMDEQAGSLNLETDKDALVASGASYDELMMAGDVVTNPLPTEKEKEEAGRILYENKNTEFFRQMMDGSEKLSASIASVIDFHLNLRAKEMANVENVDYPDDFENFDINSIF